MDIEMGVVASESRGPRPSPGEHAPDEQRHSAEQPRVATLVATAVNNFWRVPFTDQRGEPRIVKIRKCLMVMILGNLGPVNIRVAEDYPNGYPRLGCFMNSDESFLIYRRFGAIFSRLLLLNKQDELRAMEQRLFMLDEAVEKENPRRLMSRTYDLQEEAGEDPKSSRSLLLARIERTALEYSKTVRRTSFTKNL